MFLSKFFNKKLIYLSIIFLALFVVARIYYFLTDDFRISNITYEMPYHSEWETEKLKVDEQKNLDQILVQKFHYIGKGSQSYAFVSDDGKYVLKFFKFKHLRPSLLFGILPKLPFISNFQEREIFRKKRKLNSNFIGYKLAFDRNRENSRLIFVQLNPNHRDYFVKVVDKMGRERLVNLGTIPYIVQEKGQTLRTVLQQLLESGNIETAKERVNQIFDMYLTEYNKGLFDHDHGVMCNTGFIGEEPFHLDIGKLLPNEQMKELQYYEQDLILVAKSINRWLKENYASEYPQMKRSMEIRLSSIFGKDYSF